MVILSTSKAAWFSAAGEDSKNKVVKKKKILKELRVEGGGEQRGAGGCEGEQRQAPEMERGGFHQHCPKA